MSNSDSVVPKPVVAYFHRSFYFDDSSGAAIASRALLEYLARQDFAMEMNCGSSLLTLIQSCW